MSMTEVSQLERQLEDSKHLIKQRDQAIKLYSNPDFHQLIIKEFCTEECARFAQQSADPILTVEQRTDALGMAQAAGHLKRYLSMVIQMGNTAENQIEDLNQAIVEARQEVGE